MAAVDYRLAPEHKFPAAVEGCVATYRWLRAHAGDLDGDSGHAGPAGDLRRRLSRA